MFELWSTLSDSLCSSPITTLVSAQLIVIFYVSHNNEREGCAFWASSSGGSGCRQLEGSACPAGTAAAAPMTRMSPTA